jgi:hypothetical protein
MPPSSQHISWKLFGLPPEKRKCCVCDQPIVFARVRGGVDFMESELDADGHVLVRHMECKRP